VKYQHKRLLKFAAIGTASALGLGASARFVFHPALPYWLDVVIATVVVAISARVCAVPLWTRPVTPNPEVNVWVPEADPATHPRYNSRRWARAMYHNGIITIDELARFYVEHPEDMRDADR
jgi:hypothetical protein